jgi:hypothetical protein
MDPNPSRDATIGYVVSAWPRLSETFILNEVIGVERLGGRLRIFLIKDPKNEPVHAKVAQVRAPVTYLTMVRNRKAIWQANLRLLFRQPERYVRTLLGTFRYRRWKVLRRFFQASYLVELLRQEPLAHLHAHFANDPAMVTMFVHQLTGIPYETATRRSAFRQRTWEKSQCGLLNPHLKLFEYMAAGRAFFSTSLATDRITGTGPSKMEGYRTRPVRPLAYVAEDAVVLYPLVSGAPLCDHLRHPNGRLATCLKRAGASLHALHKLPEAAAGPFEFHDFAAEMREVARASRPIPALLPRVGAAIDALLDRARELHGRLPQEPPTFIHGDFKSEHLYVVPAGLTLIDFDTSRLGDPALDVGKFLADLQLWHAAYNQPGLEQAQQSFLAGYAPGATNECLIRARLYEAVELVKLTARRVLLFERDWAPRTARLVGRAQALINDLQNRLGLPAPAVGSRVTRHLSKARAHRNRPHQASARGGRC